MGKSKSVVKAAEELQVATHQSPPNYEIGLISQAIDSFIEAYKQTEIQKITTEQYIAEMNNATENKKWETLKIINKSNNRTKIIVVCAVLFLLGILAILNKLDAYSVSVAFLILSGSIFKLPNNKTN